MQAGRMKYRLEMLEAVTVTDRYGAETQEWVSRDVIHAERVKASGRRSHEAGEQFADYRAEFNVRDAHPVTDNWRVRQLGGCLYVVVCVIPNIDRGMKTLVCERVNL